MPVFTHPTQHKSWVKYKKIGKHFSACCLETIFNHWKDLTQIHSCTVKNLKLVTSYRPL